MMHRILIGLAVLAAAAVAASPAAAGPLLAVAVAAVGAAFGLGSFGTALVGIGAAFGLSLLSGMLKPEPARQKAAPSGAKLEVQASGDIPRTLIFGRAAVAGHLVYHNVHGKDEKHLQLVYVLADCECDGLANVWVDGEKKGLFARASEGGAHATYGIGGYRPDADEPDIVVRFFRGTMDQGADGELVAHAQEIGGGNTAKRWTAQHRGRGVCYVSLTLTYDPEVFPGGLPEFLWEVRGARLYDARKDSTAGGRGNHRWRDKSTWEWTENPPVCAYNYYRGYYRDDVRIGGMGVPSHDLPTASFITAANICDEEINGRARYVCSVITSEETEHRDAIQAFLDAMAGNAYELAGLFAIEAGAAQGVVATLTDGDLVVGAATTFSSMLPRSETANYVTGTYLEPAKAWSMNGYEALQVDSWEATDGGERIEMQLDLPSVPNKKQARRVRLIRGEEMRCQGRMTVTVGWKWLALAPGDWITWRKHGINTWRIEGRTLNLADLTITLRLREIKRSVYNGAVDDEPDVLVIPPFKPSLPTTVTGLAVQAGLVQRTEPRQKLPCLVVTWVEPREDRRVTSVVVEVRVIGEETAERFEQADPSKGRLRITRGILAGQDYEVRATITTRPGRPTAWTGWTSVTTGEDFVVPRSRESDIADLAKRLYDEAIDLDQLDKEIKGFLRDIANLGALLSDVRRAPAVPGWPEGFGTRAGVASLFPFLNPRDLIESLGEAALVNQVQVYEEGVKREQRFASATRALSTQIVEEGRIRAQEVLQLVAQYDGAAAQIVQISTALAGLDEAYAQQFTALTAEIADAAAQIIIVNTARVDGDEALAQQLQELSAEFGGNLALINTELTATVNELRATADALTALSADFGDFSATASTQLSTLSSKVESYAASLTTLTASVGRKVYVQKTAPPGGDYAVGDLWIKSSDLSKYRWTGTQWVVATAGWLAANASAVQIEAIARVTETIAIAGQLTTLTATVGGPNSGLTGQIRQIGIVQGEIEDKVASIEAKWGVSISLSGAPNNAAFFLGMKRIGDDFVREMIFLVDKFTVWDGKKSNKPFVIIGGKVYIGSDLIIPGSITAGALAAGAVTTDILAANAVSNFLRTKTGSPSRIAKNKWVRLISRSMKPVEGGSIIVEFEMNARYAFIDTSTQRDVKLEFELRRRLSTQGANAGVAIDDAKSFMKLIYARSSGGQMVLEYGDDIHKTFFDDNPPVPAGNTTVIYEIWAQMVTEYVGNNLRTVATSDASLICMSIRN